MEFFEALARGSGSPKITRFLWNTELSRRLLLIVSLFRDCEAPGALDALPPAADAWSILNEAREADRAAVDDLLLHPQVGNAAAYALRRQRGGANSDFPTWTDLGLVQTLALIAAARAGLTWSTVLPARYGTVMLPTLGLAKFSAAVAASTVEARTEAGTIYLRADGREVVVGPDPTLDTEHWWHLRHVLVGSNLPLTIWLDDLDPFRDLADPVPPGRLDDEAVDRWRTLLDEAWTLLCTHHAESAAALAEGVISLVPLPTRPGHETRSASNGEAFGSMMVSEPPDAVTLAVALVHEFQHIKLGALMHLLTLAEDDGSSLYYAPWRDDPRPLNGFIQGIYAFFGIAEFWRRHRLTLSGTDAVLAGYEYLYARGQTIEALHSVRDAATLTGTGRELVLRLGSVVDTWLSDQVTPEIERLARLTAGCHRTAWRLRHRRVVAAEAALLAEAFSRRRGPEFPSTPTVGPDPAQRWPQRIPTLARRRILGVGTPASPNPLATADLALVHGDIDTALSIYQNRLAGSERGSDEEIQAWVGLTLALSESSSENGGQEAARALTCRPDLVRAVHIRVGRARGRAVDPVEIAAWLAPVVKDG
ncbi:HEXXH motif domain-containing protein [Virgisporangium aurantiacum]|uniref:HEXXH motif domain-containing protein n=1 Tax=Virgisporangium aurantiacum TaxID=175570 RepID=A0A8J3Z116_9ACTN|nr:HEXXH motif domain-containing protein [Virgisporangium aurantiacum]GIJ53240.1 HEXXH motif domain-containing protein [Virgisporangium aurantiacum]